MPFQVMSPIERTFELPDLDPGDPPTVTFRQARVRENQVRDRLIFGEQARTFTTAGVRLEGTVPWTVREEIECRLTLCGATGFLDENGQDLFKFRNGALAMKDNDFHEAWGRLPSHVATMLHQHCLDANPDWDYRVNPNSQEESSDE